MAIKPLADTTLADTPSEDCPGRRKGHYILKVENKTVIVTGGGSGIGRALCQAFAREGARGVVVSDVNADSAERVASEIGGLAVQADVGVEADVQALVERTREAYGAVDLFCCNAGIALEGGAEVPDEEWQRIFQINFMAHVYAARAVVPEMLERGSGGFLVTASAAGLLTQIGSAPYAVTKHAAVAFAEWLSVTHGDRGLQVFCLCPQGVRTAMMQQFEDESAIGDYLAKVAVSPEDVAEVVLKAMEQETFMILPHPEVAEFFRRKAGDYDRWLGGMRRFQTSLGKG